jgi:hypothetical protein
MIAMHEFDVHVCLVSAQAAPNLLPVLDEQFAPKSKRIFMLVTPDMEENAKGLNAVFKKHNFITEIIPVDGQYDLDAIQEKLLRFLADHEDEKVALNVTGGTKIMALAAHSVFSMDERPIFYVREDNNSIILMQADKETGKYPVFHLNNQLTLRDYLRAYGYVANPKKSIYKPGFAEEMLKNQKKYQPELSRLNGIVWNGDDQQLFFRVHNVDYVQNVLELCRKHALLEFNDTDIKFADLNCRAYVCGGWLEAHTYAVVNSIYKGNIQPEAEQNLTIIKNGVPNELDIAFLAKNTLHIIECKTSRLETEKGVDALYKLNTITQKMGLKTKSMLVTYKNLDSYNTEYGTPNKDRAEQYNIKVIEGNELRNLKDHLEKWIAE